MRIFIFIVILSFLIYVSVFRKSATPHRISGFGNRRLRELGLNEDEIKHLNNLKIEEWDTYYIDFCMAAIVKLYIGVSRKFPELKKQDTQTAEAIFAYCGRMIQTKYSYKIYQRPTLEELTPEIDPDLKNAIDILSHTIDPLTEKQEKKLNDYDPFRWKGQFELFQKDLEKTNDCKVFYENILHLMKLNKGKPSCRTILHQSHQLLAGKNNALSCKCYIYYLNTKSDRHGHRGVLNRDKRILFKNEAKLKRFEQIVLDFQAGKNFDRAFSSIEELFSVHYRRIELDPDAVSDAVEKHDSIVRLLNPYLTDNEETPQQPEVLSANEEMKEKMKNVRTDDRKELINLFVLNDYRLNQKEVDIFAEKKRVFKSQLVDAINEIFYEQLEDVLIEEAGDELVMNIEYYQQVKDNDF